MNLAIFERKMFTPFEPNLAIFRQKMPYFNPKLAVPISREPIPSFEEVPENMEIIGIDDFLEEEQELKLEEQKQLYKKRFTETQNRQKMRKISLGSTENLHSSRSRSEVREAKLVQPKPQELEYWELSKQEEKYYEDKILNRYLERKNFFYKV